MHRSRSYNAKKKDIASNQDNEYEYLKNYGDTERDGGGQVKGSELWFFYLKTEVETEEEILIYDFSEIVAGVGGSLGLFLGFSCFQVGVLGAYTTVH